MELKFFREKRNISQNEIARYLGISQQCYSRYERGDREMSYCILIKIADFFECSIDELIGRAPSSTLFDDARIPKSEIQSLFDSMTPAQQAKLIAYAQGMLAAGTVAAPGTIEKRNLR